jgi:putative membrane protein
MSKLGTGSFIAALLASTAVFAQGNTLSQPPASMQSTTTTQYSVADQKFIDDAAIGGQFEVASGKLAEKSASPKVREFGSRMVHDHSAAGDRLKSIVTARNGTLPQQLDQTHQQDLDHLASMKGVEFDHQYMQEMVQDHDKDAQAFADAGRTLTDPQLKRFAQETLPMIKEHDKMAHEIASSMTGGPHTVSEKR